MAAYRDAFAAAAKARGYWPKRDAAYAVLAPFYKQRPIAAGLRASSLQLLERLIQVGKPDETQAA